ncbi:cytidylyltransferase domain-containing protein [uncultured Cohaesibacter sp.]|uniref:cytidylyltransferase domain-containing protein n=1 Tax=uncultured Cohaesibacter sp. TaxID=1002546 RepID=UPI0029C99250|nr:NTP transferase domain-containing protein [uncultured Cohaesibacter sp.]
MSIGTTDINPIVLIPACMTSNRLPNKPMMDIGGAPMIVQVWRRAMEAGIGPVLVAADSHEIAQVIRDAGGDAVVTNPVHPSGSDRICEALEHFDPNHRYNIVVDVQGDLPTIDPAIIRSVLDPLQDPAVDISTLAVEITEESQKDNPNVVKVVGVKIGPKRLKALYFTPRQGTARRRHPLSSHRPLRLSPQGARNLQRPAGFPARRPGASRTVAGARSRHEDRCGRGRGHPAGCGYHG